MIIFDKVNKSFNANVVLKDFSLHIQENKIYTFFGPNGCGKSTLMNMLSGLIKPDSGAIIGQDSIQHRIGYMFQDYRRHLLPWLSVRQNILFPLQLKGYSKQDQNERLDKLLGSIPIHFDLDQSVLTLSGGQSQITSLLRALIIDPLILVMDEPFSAIDYETTHSLRDTIIRVAKESKLTVLFISHDLDEALYMGDHAVFLTKRPAQIHKIIDIHGPETRNDLWTTTPYFSDLKRQALEILETV